MVVAEPVGLKRILRRHAQRRVGKQSRQRRARRSCRGGLAHRNRRPRHRMPFGTKHNIVFARSLRVRQGRRERHSRNQRHARRQRPGQPSCPPACCTAANTTRQVPRRTQRLR